MTARLRAPAMALVLLAFGSRLPAQSVLLRTPNLNSGWDAAVGTVYFNFLHRFIAGDAPTRRVTNFPTFLLGTGLPGSVLLAANYATRSDLVPAYPNEWEFFARALPFKQFNGFPADIAVQGGYNLAAESFDGELSLAREIGPLRLMGAARAMSDGYGTDRSRYALAGGASIRFGRWIAVAGDVGKLLDASDAEQKAWGVGVQIGIPFTPHTLSLQTTNTNTATIQGSSLGGSERRWGFEFTVPITLARYFGDRPEVADQEAEAAPAMADTTRIVAAVDTPRVVPDSIRDPARDTVTLPVRDTLVTPVRDTVRLPDRDTVRTPPAARTTRQDTARRPPANRPAQQQPQARTVTVRMRQLQFQPGRVQITPGSTVVWRNEDQVAHTVKAADGSWESALIQPGGSYRRTFPRAGTFAITCGPHPFMKQSVVVR